MKRTAGPSAGRAGMSRRRDDYENSRWMKFRKWVDGEIDPLDHGMEIKIPGSEDGGAETQDTGGAGGECGKAGTVRKDGGLTGKSGPDASPESLLIREERGIRIFHRIYQVMSVLLCFSIIFVLLWTIAYLPVFGNAGNPDNNEVSARYIEKGLDETGAVNIVTGMILDYRAFDTFGESCVLFIASCCVFALLRIDAAGRDRQTAKRLEEANDRLFEPKNDIILQKCACVLVPLILVFGIYIVLNSGRCPLTEGERDGCEPYRSARRLSFGKKCRGGDHVPRRTLQSSGPEHQRSDSCRKNRCGDAAAFRTDRRAGCWKILSDGCKRNRDRDRADTRISHKK